MSRLIIDGGNSLSGEITVQGAKNSALPLLAATVLCQGTSVLKNCPDLSDVNASINILRHLGCKSVLKNNTVTVDTSRLKCRRIPDELMLKMRSSIIFLGAIIGKCRKAIISSPGGCELGPRPIDLHIYAMQKLGANVKERHGLIEFSAPQGLKGARIHLAFPSVGATENTILAAVTAEGKTVITNAAKEPEICDLAEFLNNCGGKIYGMGTDTIIIDGVSALKATTHSVMPDRIVAATYMSAAAMTGGKIKLNNIVPSHLAAVNDIFEQSGCEIALGKDSLTITAPEKLNRVSTIRTAVYPGFPTDAGPLVLAMLSLARGTSIMVENIFENRFRYVDELKRFGAGIKVEGRVAIVEGTNNLSSSQCHCTDLRGGAALLLAALSAKGRTTIYDIFHIKRGYENITQNFSNLGAQIYEE